ncbi:hypothetical protein [Microbacterium marinilacus]|uniref:Uncharacterized protein n=1 Tax=Microbacterium marinilacus TaxID=415209 RepID=A0ABP7BMR7_9MICO|nr:hypothetical protein [Microbacterium marinilacus]MBY0688876.1 hypothetical protein [Microbacterium marinilacus]
MPHRRLRVLMRQRRVLIEGLRDEREVSGDALRVLLAQGLQLVARSRREIAGRDVLRQLRVPDARGLRRARVGAVPRIPPAVVEPATVAVPRRATVVTRSLRPISVSLVPRTLVTLLTVSPAVGAVSAVRTRLTIARVAGTLAVPTRAVTVTLRTPPVTGVPGPVALTTRTIAAVRAAPLARIAGTLSIALGTPTVSRVSGPVAITTRAIAAVRAAPVARIAGPVAITTRTIAVTLGTPTISRVTGPVAITTRTIAIALRTPTIAGVTRTLTVPTRAVGAVRAALPVPGVRRPVPIAVLRSLPIARVTRAVAIPALSVAVALRTLTVPGIARAISVALGTITAVRPLLATVPRRERPVPVAARPVAVPRGAGPVAVPTGAIGGSVVTASRSAVAFAAVLPVPVRAVAVLVSHVHSSILPC